jgi:hypothetical protein
MSSAEGLVAGQAMRKLEPSMLLQVKLMVFVLKVSVASTSRAEQLVPVSYGFP